MNFASDNWAGVSDIIAAALAKAGDGFVPAYGGDPLTAKVSERFCEIFEREVAVFFVATGSAANALALSAVTPPGGVVFCHDDAHIAVDECNGPEFFAGGGKLVTVPGVAGKMTPDALRAALDRFPDGDVHHGRVAAVSVSQATEAGTAYSPAEVAEICAVARERGAATHMDGARFANALVAVGARPAEVTWKAGIDMLSFGGTKNGCWCAEAVIFFDPQKARDFAFIRKRAGHLFSKSRFIAAQFDAYLADDHWLELARHANAAAARLTDGINASANGRLGWPSQSNEVFAILDDTAIDRLRAAGASLHPWPAGVLPETDRPKPGETLVRLVTNFRTSADEIDRFLANL